MVGWGVKAACCCSKIVETSWTRNVIVTCLIGGGVSTKKWGGKKGGIWGGERKKREDEKGKLNNEGGEIKKGKGGESKEELPSLSFRAAGAPDLGHGFDWRFERSMKESSLENFFFKITDSATFVLGSKVIMTMEFMKYALPLS